ncbi:Ig-like domain-containing protein [Spirochaeta lutea]|uniref:BIG2 domain-containing protein n=1 Tax=Spirochaeta lutea TaxID=1480694 RepID=A0A098QTY8_9SPIO|nr:Ig-like domain-containing protein [Spirochaeta lutea]KGE70818.1 hypothetical protein DC28_15150 [Spirochaeta lutea]
MKLRSAALGALLIAVLVSLLACGPGEPEVSIDSFYLSNSASTIGYTGDVDIAVKGSTSEAGELSLVISGSDEPYATVPVEGSFTETFTVIFMEPGTYSVKARLSVGAATWDSEKTITITVEDTKVDVDSIKLSFDHNEFNEVIAGGAARDITLEFNLNEYGTTLGTTPPTNQRVTWKSSDESIATVNDEGLVSGISVGTVDITATSEEVPESGSPVSATITIKVVDSITDDSQEITVTTSMTAKSITGAGNSAVTVRFTLTQEGLEALFGENSGPYKLNISHDAAGIPNVEWRWESKNVSRSDLNEYPTYHSLPIEPGTYSIDLWAALGSNVTIPLRVWVSE